MDIYSEYTEALIARCSVFKELLEKDYTELERNLSGDIFAAYRELCINEAEIVDDIKKELSEAADL